MAKKKSHPFPEFIYTCEGSNESEVFYSDLDMLVENLEADDSDDQLVATYRLDNVKKATINGVALEEYA